MSADAHFLHKHNLDISTIENLAKDLSKRLKVNVKYGFYAYPEDMLPLYDNPLLKTATEHDGVTILETIKHPEAKETLLLTEDSFLEKRLYEKHGDDIVYTKEFQKAFACYKEKFDHTHSMLRTYKSDRKQLCYDVEGDENSKYGSMFIHKHYLDNSLFDYYDWRQLTNRVLGTELDNIEDAYSFTEFRFNLMHSVLKLGGDTVYVVPFGGGDNNFEGIGEGEEWEMEWTSIQETIEKNGKHRLFNFSHPNHNRPIEPHYFFEVWEDIEPYKELHERGELSDEEYKEKLFEKINNPQKSNNPNDYPLAFKDDFEDLNKLMPYIDFDYLGDRKSEEDPVVILYKYLQEAENKAEAKTMALLLDLSVDKITHLDAEMSASFYHIIACVFIWCNLFEKAAKAQEAFLDNKVWREENRNFVEAYLLMLFAKNNIELIEQTLEKYPFIKSDYKECYQTYLSAIVDPDSSEYYDKNLFQYYKKLNTIQRMYC